MIVMDASAALTALVNAGTARHLLSEEQVCVPELVDTEVANGLRRCVQSGRLEADVAWALLSAWQRMGVRRFTAHKLLERVWKLRDQLDANAATYIALAEALECALVTADPELGAVTSVQCSITVVPH